MAGFWGHVGLRPAASDEYLWFPITNSTYQRVCNCESQERIVIPCMNNKVLLVNLRNIDELVLLDEACDSPGFANWDPVTLHFKSGRKTHTTIDPGSSDSLISEIEVLYDFEDSSTSDRMLSFTDFNGAEILFNMDNIALVELPYLAVEDAIARGREEMLREIGALQKDS